MINFSALSASKRRPLSPHVGAETVRSWKCTGTAAEPAPRDLAPVANDARLRALAPSMRATAVR